MTIDLSNEIDGVYILAIILFVFGLQRMGNPATARRGIVWAGVGMFFAIVVTVFDPEILDNSSHLAVNLVLMVVAIALGGGVAYWAAKIVKMTDMPQMIAIYNGMGGGAAATISAITLISGSDASLASLVVTGGLIGSISFAGSMIAFLKLQGWIGQKAKTFPGQRVVNIIILLIAIAAGVLLLWSPTWLPAIPGGFLWVFFAFGLLYGLAMTLPIGGADMPVVISLYNAFTGMAVGLDGFALGNYAMIVAGVLVGAAGTILTLLMAKAMNRSVANVMFSAFGATEEAAGAVQGTMRSIEVDDAAVMLAYASKVIIAPGYGMAVAQAQHKVKELMDIMEGKGVMVKFAIHPVAGRMPGHMNVLLAEAGVPYDRLFDLDEINQEFPSADVVLVIGANDTVNPAARRAGSPLQGMPILNVDQAKEVIVLKRGQGKGFAGVENDLFFKDNTRMLYGDAQETVTKLTQALKKL